MPPMTGTKHLKDGSTLTCNAALELRAHGHDKLWREVLLHAIESQTEASRGPIEQLLDRRALSNEDELNGVFHLARALYFADSLETADSLFRRLTGQHPDTISCQGYLGAIAARSGRREEAEEVMDRLSKIKQPYIFGKHEYFCARIASILGLRQDAMEYLKAVFQHKVGSSAYGIVYFHIEPDFDNLKEYPQFKIFLKPKKPE
jgi:predicted Zn-dependent protease